MNFAQLLQSLRVARGLSQTELAERSGIALNTIQRGEQLEAKRCPWRRSTVTRVLTALDKVIPLSHEEYDQWGDATDMRALVEHLKSLEGVARTTAQSRGVKPDADLISIQLIITELIDEVGPKKLLQALEGMAVAWSVDPPSRVTDQDITTGRYLRLIKPPVHYPGGWVVQEFIPMPATANTPGQANRAQRPKATPRGA